MNKCVRIEYRVCIISNTINMLSSFGNSSGLWTPNRVASSWQSGLSPRLTPATSSHVTLGSQSCEAGLGSLTVGWTRSQITSEILSWRRDTNCNGIMWHIQIHFLLSPFVAFSDLLPLLWWIDSHSACLPLSSLLESSNRWPRERQQSWSLSKHGPGRRIAWPCVKAMSKRVKSRDVKSTVLPVLQRHGAVVSIF